MAINWSASALINVNHGILKDLDLDQQFTSKLSPKGYSSDAVEWQLWWVWKMPIVFEWKKYNSTPNYLGITGVFIPAVISGLPNSLWYARNAAYSVAESYGQLKNRGTEEYTNDQILQMIITRVIELFQEEIERIQEYINQENVVLMPELEKKFERHLGMLEYYLDIFSGKIWGIKAENTKQDVKTEVENVFEKQNLNWKKAVNDDFY